jgi:hypothetical protein
MNRMSYGMSESVAEFDQWKEWGHDGALTATAWIDTSVISRRKRPGPSCAGARPSPACLWPLQAWKRRHRGRPRRRLDQGKRPVTEDALAGAEEILGPGRPT